MSKSCRDCRFSRSGPMGELYCMWEKENLPPAVWRARLWGKADPRTYENFAEKCNQYEALESDS